MLSSFVYAPPRLPQFHLLRPRLSRSALQENTRVKLFCSPMGTGKTVVLLECLASIDKNSPIHWVPEISDFSLSTFSEALATALHIPYSDTRTLIEYLANYKKDLNIVIDNYNNGLNNELDQFLVSVISLSAPTITWWITTRLPLNHKFSRLIIEGDAYEFTNTEELAFSSSEIHALFDLKGTSVSSKQQMFISKHTQGWCIAVRALLADSEAISSHCWSTNLRHHLETIFLDTLNNEDKELWLLLAHLRTFNSALVAYILEDSEQHCLQRIQAFIEQGFFISSLNNDLKFHVFTPMANFVHQKSFEQAYSWHLYASQWHAGQGNWQAAVEHALRAGKDEEALSMVQKVSDEESIGGENIAVLMQLKSTASHEILFSTPRLVSLIAGAQVFTGQLEGVDNVLENFSKFLPQPDPISQIKMLAQWQALKGWKLHLQGDQNVAQQHLKEAISCLPEEFWEISLTCYSALTQQALLSAELIEASHLNATALRSARERKSSLLEAYLELDHAQMLEHQGLLTDAERVLENACLLLNEDDVIQSPILGRLQLRLGQLHLRQGRLAKAKHYFIYGLQETLRWGDHRALYGHSGLAFIDLESHAYDRAIERLRDAERSMQKNHIPDIVYRYYLRFCYGVIYLHQRNFKQAEQSLIDVLDYYQQNPTKTPPPASFELIPRCKMYLALTSLLQNNFIQAQRYLNNIIVYAEHQQLLTLREETRVIERLNHALPQHSVLNDQQIEYIFEPCRALGLYGMIDEIIKLFPHAFSEHGQSTEKVTELLSPRELEVLQHIAEGFASKQIATQMHISLNTVKAHIQRIFKKLNVSRRTQAVAKAQQLGLFKPN